MQTLKGYRILLAEDNELSRFLTSTILARHGADVTAVVNGRLAIEQLQRRPFDLLLIDLQMPVMDGTDAATYIRRHISTTMPIIALTANGGPESEQSCVDAGMNGCISKPFSEYELVRQVAHRAGIVPAAEEVYEDTAQPVSAPLYDLGKLQEMARGDDGFVQKMVALFIDKTPPLVLRLKDAYTSGDGETVAALAHRIKTSIGIMSISSVLPALERLEDSIVRPLPVEEKDKLIAHVTDVLNKVTDQLRLLREQ